MTSSHSTPASCQWFSWLAAALDRRSAPRLALLLFGAVLARGRRTVTTWIRAAKLSDQFRPCYTAVAAAGKRADRIARRLLTEIVEPLVAQAGRLTLALDDTPTQRYGPQVQGAGVHHNPTPGPAGSSYVYGHVFVVLGLLVNHKAWGVIALPLLARLYVREKDLPGIPCTAPHPKDSLGVSRPRLAIPATSGGILMPLAIRASYDDADGEGAPVDDGEYVEPLPAWRARADLTDDEVSRVRDLTMLWLRRGGFSDRMIGQIMLPARDPDQTRHMVQKRLKRMFEEFSAGGFRLVEIP